jgi:hypothetical protein
MSMCRILLMEESVKKSRDYCKRAATTNGDMAKPDSLISFEEAASNQLVNPEVDHTL